MLVASVCRGTGLLRHGMGASMRREFLLLIFVLAIATAYAISQQAPAASQNPNARVTGNTAQSETQNNTAGSIAGNSGAVSSTPGQPKANPQSTPAGTAAGTAAPSADAPAASGGVSGAATVGSAQGESRQHNGNPPAAGTNASGSAAAGNTAGGTNSNMGATAESTTGDFGSGQTDANTLRTQIESAFQSDPTLSNSNIQVTVSENEITLTGSVPSGKEKTTARRIAQSYGSNRRVNDKVTVTGRGNQNASGAAASGRSGAIGSSTSQGSTTGTSTATPSPDASTQGSSTSVVTGQGADAPQGGNQVPKSDPKTEGDQSPSPR